MIKFMTRLQYSGLPGRVRFGIGLVLFLCIFVGMENTLPRGSASAQAADLEILTPQAGAKVIARSPETHLVLRQSGSAETTRLRVEKSGVTLDPVVSMEGDESIYLHFRLPLEPGMNKFTVMPSGQGIELNFQKVQADLNLKSRGKATSFFHQNDKLPKSCQECHELRETETIEPVGLKKQVSCVNCHQNLVDKGQWKHGPTVNRQCLSCHQQSSDPWRIGFPKIRTQEICLGCHTSKKAWFERRAIHGPLDLGGCTLCHNPHGEDHRYMLWAEGSLTLCVVCHSDKENLVDEDKKKRPPYVHGIIFGKGCVACHDPHATDNHYMLKKSTNKLCVGCHNDLAGVTRGHPIAGHPVAGPTELLRPGRKLTCSSCHEPHGSNHQYLLIETKLGDRLCRGCHKR